MIVPDINLLIFAHNPAAPQHDKARTWWEACLNGTTPVGVPWVTISGYLRLMTHPRVLVHPLDAATAVAHVEEWLAQPPVRLLHPGTRFAGLFFGYLKQLGTAGNLTTDIQLAALTAEHQAELHSCDTGFHRFPGLRWTNPLQ